MSSQSVAPFSDFDHCHCMDVRFAVRVGQSGGNRGSDFGFGSVERQRAGFIHVDQVDGHGDGGIDGVVGIVDAIFPVRHLHGQRGGRAGLVVQQLPGDDRDSAGVRIDGERVGTGALVEAVGQGVAVGIGGNYRGAHGRPHRRAFRHRAAGGCALAEFRQIVAGGNHRPGGDAHPRFCRCPHHRRSSPGRAGTWPTSSSVGL